MKFKFQQNGDIKFGRFRFLASSFNKQPRLKEKVIKAIHNYHINHSLPKFKHASILGRKCLYILCKNYTYYEETVRIEKN